MKIPIALAATVAALTVIGAQSPSVARPAQSRNECFWARTVTGFAAPDNQTLYVRAAGNHVYRFDMFGPCLDMDWNQRLALVSHSGGSICSGMDAEVVSRATGLGRQRCPVRGMHMLSPEEVAALPRRARP